MDKFPKFDKLHGSSNFHSWRMMVYAYMDLNNLYNIVTGEEKDPKLNSPKTSTSDENYEQTILTYKSACEDWRYRHSLSRAFILFNVDSTITPQITCYTNSWDMWKTLNDLFDRKNEYSLHALVKSLVGIKCNSTSSISDHIAKYNELWSRLIERTVETHDDDPDSLEAALRPLAKSTKAKGSLFLTTLPSELDNIVDNLKTKQHLTYDDVCQRLMELSIASTSIEDPQAFFGKERKERKNSIRECSYCKSNKRWFKGHTIQNCRNKKREERDEDGSKANLVESDENDNEVAYPASTSRDNEWKWIFDTGATSHMTGNKAAFDSLRAYAGSIKLGNDMKVEVTHIGNIKLNALLPDGKSLKVTLYDVLYAPKLKCSLMSWETIKSKGITMEGNEREIILWKNGRKVGWVISKRKENIFQEVCHEEANVSVRIWHRRLGHFPIRAFDDLKKVVADPEVLPVDRPIIDCETCEKSKMVRNISKDTANSCTDILQKIHSDVSGPFSTKSLGGKLYYVTFIDEYSRYIEVKFITHKHEVEDAVKEFIKRVERQTEKKVKIFKSDNGGEYISKSLIGFFKSVGIKIENSIPRIHETNGLAERTNRTITTMARTNLIDSELPQYLWAEAVAHAVYTKNRIPHTFIKKTPFEVFYGKKPHIGSLKYFGQKAYIHIPSEARIPGSKFQSRAQQAVLVGYSEKPGWYRFWNGMKVSISRDYKFPPEEDVIVLPTLGENGRKLHSDHFGDWNVLKKNNETESPSSPEPSTSEISPRLSCPSSSPELSTSDILPRRSCRQRNPPTRFDQEFCNIATDEPVSYNEAVTCPESKYWIDAINDELKSMEENEVWDIVQLPAGEKPVGCRWIFKKKLSVDGKILKYKARLVAQGFSQIPGTDFQEVFSPVVRYETIRILIAHAVHRNMVTRQMDIKTAFLNGELDCCIFMKIPEGVDAQPGRVCRLKKSIYGLKQSPRQWNHKLVRVLTQIQLEQSQADPCLFMSNDGSLIVAIYVDDILVLGTTVGKVEIVENLLTDNFEVTHLGIPRYLLSIQITWHENYAVLHQEQYINIILEKYGLVNCKPTHTPMDIGTKPEKGRENDERSDKIIYQSKIGSLLYLAMGTRPDIAHAVNVLSQFCVDPTVIHSNMVQHLMRYLKGTKKKCLIYKRSTSPYISMYSDASYASCLDDRKSYSGYIAFYGQAVVCWSSKKQQSVAVSTTEAEYMALSAACRQTIWMSYITKDLRVSLSLKLYCDNQASIHLSHNPVQHQRSKHIDVHYHYVRERVLEKDVSVIYVASKDNIADLLTKPLGKIQLNYLCSKFMNNLP